MIFQETRLKGAYLVQLDPIEDERGSFARTFCRREFSAHGLKNEIAQANVSFNRRKGTLRGMHFQNPPRAEAKLVRCTEGAIFDVIIDLRVDSPTYSQWVGAELRVDNHSAFYIPEGFAHGFQTLQDNSEIFYLMFEFYAPEYAGGVRWDDPFFGIRWPILDPILSNKDRSYPLFKKDRG